jgi:hypothetical protein
MMPQAINRKIFFILVLLCLTGCAGFKEAFDERIGGRFSGVDQNIRLKCDVIPDTRRADNQFAETNGALQVGIVKDHRLNKRTVGKLFDWYDFILPPIRLQAEEGEKLSEDLRDHLIRILRGNDIQAPALLLDAEILKVLVWSPFPGLSDLKLTVVGEVSFEIVLVNRESKEVLLYGVFRGVEKIQVLYDLKRYHEEALKTAYCRALERFTLAIEEEIFKNTITEPTTK